MVRNTRVIRTLQGSSIKVSLVASFIHFTANFAFPFHPPSFIPRSLSSFLIFDQRFLNPSLDLKTILKILNFSLSVNLKCILISLRD